MDDRLDMNAVAGYYARKSITVKGVFHAVVPAQSTLQPYTEKRPTPTAGFVFVIRGSGSFTFDGSRYELDPGVVVHGGPHMSLVMTTQESELEYYLVRYEAYAVTENGDKPEERSYSRQHYMLDPGTVPEVIAQLRQLHESFYTPGGMASIRTQYLFGIVLYATFSSCLNRQNSASYMKVEQARAYIHDHYMDSITLRTLAERSEMSVKSFSYLFHKYYGLFPIDYLIQHRMKRAQELLAVGRYTVKQVAATVGYEDPLYFSRLYKKHVGCTPSQSQRIRK